MSRKLSAALAIAVSLAVSLAISLAVSLPLAPAAWAAPAPKAAPIHKKRHVTRHWHGYGFLPGYRPPEVIARERALSATGRAARIITGPPGRASTAAAGTAAASAPAGRKRRSGRCGIAANSGLQARQRSVHIGGKHDEPKDRGQQDHDKGDARRGVQLRHRTNMRHSCRPSQRFGRPYPSRIQDPPYSAGFNCARFGGLFSTASRLQGPGPAKAM